MDRLWLLLMATGAGIIVALLGWLDSKEPFSPRKFAASCIRALIAGIIWGAAYSGSLKWEAILAAIASGPFFDTVINRIATIAGNSSFPLPKA
jgi:hypothetical protein